MFLEGIPFKSATEAGASLVGFQLARPEWRSSRSSVPVKDVCDRWRSRPTPSPGSGAWRYLCWGRWIPTAIARQAIREGILREGPFGSMWARSEEHTSELQSLMRISYAVFCLKKKHPNKTSKPQKFTRLNNHLHLTYTIKSH